MEITIYSATGCTRCKIAKDFMKEKGISYVEHDMKAEGKEAFQKFYAANRKAIFRGPEGVEFPIITDGTEIRQSIAAVIGYLHAGKKLNDFFGVGTLHKEWVNGIHVSGGNAEHGEEFLEVLRFLKGINMKLQIDTNGKNADLLKRVLDEGLADVMIMNVLGPRELYSTILGEQVDTEEIAQSMALVTQFPEYKFQTTIAPVVRPDGEISYLSPAELGDTAQFIKEATGSMKNPYFLKMFKPKECKDERFKGVKALDESALLPYRTKARAHQVFVEIAKA